MKKQAKKSKKVKVPSFMIVGTKAPNGKDLYESTMKGKDGVTEDMVNLLSNLALNQRDKVLFEILWETGVRVGELLSLERKNLQGDKLRIMKNKQKYVCLNCGIHKVSHYPNKKTKCHDYIPKVVPRFKTILLSPETLADLGEYLNGISSEKLFNISDRMVRKILKTYHKDLSPHQFRRGRGIWLMKNGANKEQVISLLGHSDYQSLNHYISHQENELNEFLGRVYSGVDTRKIGALTVDEFKALLNN